MIGSPVFPDAGTLRPFVKDTELAARLGCRPTEIPAETRAALETVLGAAEPRYLVCPVTFRADAGGVTFPFGRVESAPLGRLLSGCRDGYLIAATLGHGIDSLLRRAAAGPSAGRFLLDCAASAAADGLCDLAESILPHASLTPRFSPGYGGWELSGQRDVLSFLRADSLLGIRLTDTGLMLPTKSVTAVLGVRHD